MTGSRTRPRSIWRGVLVAVTTPFDPNFEVDGPALVDHVARLVANGVDGIVVGGSLGEGASLSLEERVRLVTGAVSAAGPRVPVVAAIGAARTAEAVGLARSAVSAGASGLLVLPPYVYRGDRRETHEHFRAVLRATEVPGMLYNNPAAYGTDVSPDEVLELAEELPMLTGVKESSGDVRRIAAIRALLGERVEVAVGLDDAVLEGVAAGAVGWVAGLANAFPEESVRLFRHLERGERDEAWELYRWFLPLLRRDTGPKFVQEIKALQSDLGLGSARVRPPRLPLCDAELLELRALTRAALESRPGAAKPPPGRTRTSASKA